MADFVPLSTPTVEQIPPLDDPALVDAEDVAIGGCRRNGGVRRLAAGERWHSASGTFLVATGA